MSNEIPETANEYREQRIRNLHALAELGYQPFGGAFERTGRLADIRAAFAEGREVRAAGRLMSIRAMGKSVFADLHDGSDRFQIYLNKKELAEAAFEAFGRLDMGDQIGVTGKLFVTRMGEQSLHVASWTLLAKAILQPPEKFHGLVDTEERYRKRYLDLISNPEVRARFNIRIAVMQEIRSYLVARGFQEVETPMMQPQAGGATARPFVTRYHALDCDMYMRIAPELYLKRLLVGGFDRVFEMNRNFRNEGLDRTHNPEFTVLEVYEAFGDRASMKRIIEDLLPRLCRNVLGRMTVESAETREVIDFTPPYREVSYQDLVRERMGADWFDLGAAEARAKAVAAGVEVEPQWNHLMVTHEVYNKLIEKSLRQPTFVVRIPRPFVPLAKACADDPTLADVFEFVVAGKELCPGYTEQNNPFEQRIALADQAGENTEKIDEDFITALEHGMPPAGGMGLGIDRLVMLLTGTEAIRDVILFPQLKARGSAGTQLRQGFAGQAPRPDHSDPQNR